MKKNLLILVAMLASWTMYAGAENAVIKNSMSVTSGSKGSGVYRPNQKNQPFQAFAGLSLSGGDYIYTKNGVSQKIGHVEYTYDADGKMVRSETTLKNVDGAVFQESGYQWNTTIPVDAVYNNIEINTDDLEENTSYYIDPITSERVELSHSKRIYYNGETVYSVESYLNEKGEWTESRRAESEFDSEERPLSTIYYTESYLVDSITGKITEISIPYRRVEYEYRPDNLVTSTSYYLRYDRYGNEYWEPNYKITTNTDQGDVEYYEALYYSSYDSVWYGNQKYISQTEEYNGGERITNIDWYWNSGVQDWEVNRKSVSIYNSADNIVRSEQYAYDTLFAAFYLVSMNGYDYIGDTLRCADWNIDFYRPDSLNQFETYPMSLVGGANRTEYAYYTYEELGLPATASEYLTLPRKYKIDCILSRIDSDGSLEWTALYKTEYDYDLRSFKGRENPSLMITSNKEFYYRGGEWYLSDEWRYDYNEYGDQILSEKYNNGIILTRESIGYEYRVRYYSLNDSTVERFTSYVDDWSRNYEGYFVCESTTEYQYDSQGRTIYEARRSDWDQTLDTWSYGSRNESEYDENGHKTMSAYYYWDSENQEWVGREMDINMYDDSGRNILSEYYGWDSTYKTWIGSNKREQSYDESGFCYYDANYYGEYNENDNATVWIPSSLSQKWKDNEGHLLRVEDYYSWNTYTSAWSDGRKDIYTYSESGLKSGQERMELYDGTWYNTFKEEYVYNEAGNIILYVNYNYDTFLSDWYINEKSEYAYTESGELTSLYSYERENGELMLKKKKTASTTIDGRILDYTESVYIEVYDDETGASEYKWIPSSKEEFIYDDVTGLVTYIGYDWNSYYNSWRPYSKEIKGLDSEGRIIYFESYYRSNGYYGDTLIWIGEDKYEREYDAYGKVIMNASYYWDSSDSEWVGSYKEERAVDPFNDRTTLHAEYRWDYERKDWRGNYNKREELYDSEGNMLLYAEYYWDDNVWGWVGSSRVEYEYDTLENRTVSIYFEPDAFGGWVYSSKRVYGQVDNVDYSEYYEWDSRKQEWCGKNKREHCYYYDKDSTEVSMNSSYYWDVDEWCWVGDYKNEYRYWNDGGYERAEYKWDVSGKCWVGTLKKYVKEEDTDTRNTRTIVSSRWDNSVSGWELDYRESDFTEYRSDLNIEKQVMTVEKYQSSSWILDYTVELTFDYSVWDGVEDIIADFTDNVDISVFDGGISVVSADDAVIRIFNASGNSVATGTGSVTTSVAPGIYYISVNAKTIKILVR